MKQQQIEDLTEEHGVLSSGVHPQPEHTRNSFHFVRRLVTRFRNNLILDIFTLLVRDAERFVRGGVHQLDLNVTKLPIA